MDCALRSEFSNKADARKLRNCRRMACAASPKRGEYGIVPTHRRSLRSLWDAGLDGSGQSRLNIGLDLQIGSRTPDAAFLGSGIFSLRRHLEHGVRFGLGTDVGAGTGLSLLKEGLMAYHVQMVRHQGHPLSPAHLLHLF